MDVTATSYTAVSIGSNLSVLLDFLVRKTPSARDFISVSNCCLNPFSNILRTNEQPLRQFSNSTVKEMKCSLSCSDSTGAFQVFRDSLKRMKIYFQMNYNNQFQRNMYATSALTVCL